VATGRPDWGARPSRVLVVASRDDGLFGREGQKIVSARPPKPTRAAFANQPSHKATASREATAGQGDACAPQTLSVLSVPSVVV
jgi:hypothetical protein